MTIPRTLDLRDVDTATVERSQVYDHLHNGLSD